MILEYSDVAWMPKQLVLDRYSALNSYSESWISLYGEVFRHGYIAIMQNMGQGSRGMYKTVKPSSWECPLHTRKTAIVVALITFSNISRAPAT